MTKQNIKFGHSYFTLWLFRYNVKNKVVIYSLFKPIMSSVNKWHSLITRRVIVAFERPTKRTPEKSSWVQPKQRNHSNYIEKFIIKCVMRCV